MSMEVYVVFKQGIYRHECIGVFADVLSANSAAVSAARLETDDYHEFHVVPFMFDQVTNSEAGPLTIVKRKGKSIQQTIVEA